MSARARRAVLAWLVAASGAAGCAHGPGARSADRVIHVRTLVGLRQVPPAVTDAGALAGERRADPPSAGSGGAAEVEGRQDLVEAELLQADGGPARLRLSWLRPSGQRERIAELPVELAQALAREVAGGSDLRPLLEPALLDAWLPEGATQIDDGGACTVEGPSGGERPTARPWIPSTEASQPGAWALALEVRTLPRYGRAWSAVLGHRGTQIETSSDELILSRFPSTRATLLLLERDLAVIGTCASAGPYLTADRVPLDLRAGAARLLTERAASLLDQGKLEAARTALDHAERFAPSLPRFFFQQARALAREGADRTATLAALERAIEAEPTLYRMEARVAADFEPLRSDPAFVALTLPRPLPATNRAGTPPPTAPPVEVPPDETQPDPAPDAIEEEAPIELPPPAG